MAIVFVAGADRGLGYCLCQEMLERGHTVFGGWFDASYRLLHDLAERSDGRLRVLRMDLGDSQSIREAAETLSGMTDALDMYVDVAAFLRGPVGTTYRAESGIKTNLIEKSLRVNAAGAVESTSALLPLLEKGKMKRLCYVSSEVASINLMLRQAEFAYSSSKTALNMAVKMMHNELHPKGYTFRLYAPGWMREMYRDGTKYDQSPLQIDPEESAAAAADLFFSSRDDEEWPHMIDYLGQTWPH